jgi:pyruvate kinase
LSSQEALCVGAVRTSEDVNASLIIVITESGATARLVDKYKPRVTILALCMSACVIRQLNISRGIISLKIPSFIGSENLILDAIEFAKKYGYVKAGDMVICIMGQKEDTPEYVNMMKIVNIT